MTATNPIVVTGRWPERSTAKAFFERLGLKYTENGAYQLYQTWSECRLEAFCADTGIDLKYIDQYRAFCPEWELWVRNVNARELRFRLIITIEVDEKMITDGGFAVEKEVLESTRMKTALYPLWGRFFKEGSLEGWYTQEIPQLLKYPVNNGWEQVAVKVENYVRHDGTIDMVRCCSLIEFNEETSQVGGV